MPKFIKFNLPAFQINSYWRLYFLDWLLCWSEKKMENTSLVCYLHPESTLFQNTKSVTMKYLNMGHTHMTTDVVHGNIENNLKNMSSWSITAMHLLWQTANGQRSPTICRSHDDLSHMDFYKIICIKKIQICQYLMGLWNKRKKIYWK